MDSSHVTLCILFALTLSCTAMTSSESNQNYLANDPRYDARVSALVARDVLQLAQEIGTTVLKNSNEQAVVFSPLSIFGVLSILLLGSNGQTYNELMNLLKFDQGKPSKRWRCFDVVTYACLWFTDSYLARNSWKAHEEFGLLLEDIARDLPHPQRKRPAFWEGVLGTPPRRRPTNFNHNQQNETQRVAVGNGIFIQDDFSIRPEFRAAVENVYRSTLHQLDFDQRPFEAMDFMNQ